MLDSVTINQLRTFVTVCDESSFTKASRRLSALVGMPGRRPDIVLRFGYGAALPFSARRPVDAVLA